jgi:hypothetical protein
VDTIAVQVIIQEDANDTLTITRQPVQQGASITDHAYMEPTFLGMSLIYGGTNTLSFLPVSLKSIYQQFLTLQSSRSPFTITTPKRVYTNMLLASLSQTNDKSTENVLKLDCKFQQVIIVPVATTLVVNSNLGNAASNAATTKTGANNASVLQNNLGSNSPLGGFLGNLFK